MAQSLTNFDAALKEFVEGKIRMQLNDEIKLKKHLQQSSRGWSGRHVRFPVHVRRNVGVGARSESSALPSAGEQTTVESRITSAYIYGRIDLTGQVMAGSKNAFADAFAFEAQRIADDLKQDCGRQVYGTGLGDLAQVAADSNSSTAITVFNQFGEPGQPGARYIQVGQRLSAGPIGSPTDITGADVISIAIAANSGTTTDTITVSQSALDLSSSGDFLYNVGAGGANIEMKGLRGLVDDQTAANIYGRTGGMAGTVTVQNISRDTFKSTWNGHVLQNSGAERLIDANLMQQAFDTTQRASGKQVDKLIGEYDVITAYLDSVSGDRRYATKDFDTGRGDLTFNGLSLVQDLLAPYNELYGINSEALQWYVLRDFSFSDEDGSIIKNVAGFDRWEAFIKAYLQLGAEHLNRNFVIRDIKTRL